MVNSRNSLFKANPPCMTWRGGFALRVDSFTIRGYLPCSLDKNVSPMFTHIEEVLQ